MKVIRTGFMQKRDVKLNKMLANKIIKSNMCTCKLCHPLGKFECNVNHEYVANMQSN